MRLSEALALAFSLGFSAVMLWCAWRLAEGELFFAACGVFVAAFWGALAGCIVWSCAARWGHDELPPASVVFPSRARQ